MKKRIGTHLYDTDTARLIGVWANQVEDDQYLYEALLYRTRSGRYFLHERGGLEGMLKNALCDMKERVTGQGIAELSYEQAEQWASGHLPSDGYAAAFGDDNTPTQLSVRIPRRVYNALLRRSVREGCSMADLVVRSYCTYELEHPADA